MATERPDPRKVEPALWAAKRLIAFGEYRAADRILDAIEPKRPRALVNRWIHLRGLSKARQGKCGQALEILEAVPARALNADSELTGLKGRVYMDLFDRDGNVRDLELSWLTYDDGYRRFAGKARSARKRWKKARRKPDRDLAEKQWSDLGGAAYYLGINSAAKAALFGAEKEKRAQNVARDVLALIRELEADGLGDQWMIPTKAEAHLILREADEAAALYMAGVAGNPGALGSHASTWLQAQRLMRKMRVDHTFFAKIRRAFQHLADAEPSLKVLEPPHRRLLAYAFDPSLARKLDTAVINQVTLEVPWEPLGSIGPGGTRVPGPVGEYLEIIDYDPASACFYEPVDLEDPQLLATDGLAPSEGDPRFHQQMVYAVCMSVIDNFEAALGRKVLWSPRVGDDVDPSDPRSTYVQRLRVYPHALREANAYYSPDKKALLFGYFEADATSPDIVPEARIFTCLSHDVVAHEMSHALLDGIHPHFTDNSNVDVYALHEAFADVVALLQHFSHPGVLRQEIARTRGNLASEGMMGELAQEFGRAIGRVGALRSAIGDKNPSKDALQTTREPHARGAILVAAVFEAFLTIYDLRTRDLLRIATHGSGILEPGALHPDLVDRLAREASKAASHLLRMCIRALDYCPPVDVTFGDYLRALITADVDLVPDDKLHYRLAIIEAFQRRGIFPEESRNLSVESLVWRPPRSERMDVGALLAEGALQPRWRPHDRRDELWRDMHQSITAVGRWLDDNVDASTADELGLTLSSQAPGSVKRRDGSTLRPGFEVTSVRTALRTKLDGSTVTDLVVEILQERAGFDDEERQREVDDANDPLGPGDFTFRGGCTLLIDPGERRVRYAMSKHILSESRLARHRRHRKQVRPLAMATYFEDPATLAGRNEPFAMMHGLS